MDKNKKYTCNIIDAEFGSRSESDQNIEAFNASLASHILMGGEIGIWRASTAEGNIGTLLTTIGFYARADMFRKRTDETIFACWSWTETWAITCCTCGCNSSCDDCMCCCKTCEKCDDCECCCDCG